MHEHSYTLLYCCLIKSNRVTESTFRKIRRIVITLKCQKSPFQKAILFAKIYSGSARFCLVCFWPESGKRLPTPELKLNMILKIKKFHTQLGWLCSTPRSPSATSQSLFALINLNLNPFDSCFCDFFVCALT